MVTKDAGACGALLDGEDTTRAAIRAFGEVAEALNRTEDLDELFTLVAAKISELLGVKRTSIHLYDEKSCLFRGQVLYGERDSADRVKRMIAGTEADGITREMLETKQPVVSTDALNDSRAIRATMRRWDVRSFIAVPMLLQGEVVGFFFSDTPGEARTFSDTERDVALGFAELAAVAISQAKLVDELRHSIATVARQRDILRQATAIDDRLTSLVVDGCDLHQIARTLAELLGKPCAIHGPTHECLAVGTPEGVDGTAVPTALDRGLLEHPVVRDAVVKADQGRTTVVGPLPTAGLIRRLLVSPVIVRGTRCGTLVVVEHGRRFTARDMLVTRRSATIVALELSAAQRAVDLQWSARASLAAELLRGRGDALDVVHRARTSGVRLDAPQVVVLLARRDENDAFQLPEARAVTQAAQEAAPQAHLLTTETEDGIALLIDPAVPGGDEAVVAEATRIVREVRAELGLAPEIVAGISRVTRRPSSYAERYVEAKQMAHCAAAYCPVGSPFEVLPADELGGARLFIGGADPDEAMRFADETLGPVLAPGVSPTLVATLSRFLEYGGGVRQSAVSLGVHENTVRFRLRRLETLADLPLTSDSDARLRAHLAWHILRLAGRLPEVVEGAGEDEHEDAEALAAV